MSTQRAVDREPTEVERELEASWSLPSRWYHDPAIYERELEQIFSRRWILIGPEHRPANPGDHVIATAGHVPVVVTRDLRGELHGFVNVCRHRAHPVAIVDGRRRTLQCRYHGWTYGLDGRLRSVPRCGREAGFDKRELGLVPVAVDRWRGFVFVNADSGARPLAALHPELDALTAKTNVDFAGFVYRGRWSSEIPANWKVWVENSTECYHCPTVHRRSFSDAFDVSEDSYEQIEV